MNPLHLMEIKHEKSISEIPFNYQKKQNHTLKLVISNKPKKKTYKQYQGKTLENIDKYFQKLQGNYSKSEFEKINKEIKSLEKIWFTKNKTLKSQYKNKRGKLIEESINKCKLQIKKNNFISQASFIEKTQFGYKVGSSEIDFIQIKNEDIPSKFTLNLDSSLENKIMNNLEQDQQNSITTNKPEYELNSIPTLYVNKEMIPKENSAKKYKPIFENDFNKIKNPIIAAQTKNKIQNLIEENNNPQNKKSLCNILKLCDISIEENFKKVHRHKNYSEANEGIKSRNLTSLEKIGRTYLFEVEFWGYEILPESFVIGNLGELAANELLEKYERQLLKGQNIEINSKDIISEINTIRLRYIQAKNSISEKLSNIKKYISLVF